METFDFAPDSMVPETLPPEPTQVISLNGWNFSARPTVPYAKRFDVELHGIRWYLDEDGLYDDSTNPTMNARALELFYERHGTWKAFNWTHPHLGELEVRFVSALKVPKAMPNSGGLVEKFTMSLIHNNPGYV